MKKDNLEFYRVKERIQNFCGFELSKEKIAQEEVEFRYLKVKKMLSQTQEMLEFLRLGETLQFHSLVDTRSIYKSGKMGRILTGSELRNLYSNLLTTKLIKTKLEKTTFQSLRELSDTLMDSEELMNWIDEKVDVYGYVVDHASSTLQKIRKSIKETQSSIEGKLKKFINDNKEIIMDGLIVSRNDRSCVLVVISQKNKKQGLIHGESASGLAVYFEPMNVVNLNNELLSLLQKEEEAVYQILREISSKVQEKIAYLENDFNTLQELDVISAKAKYTASIDGIIPNIQRENKYFYFKNAYNPLIDSKIAIRNTYELKDKYNTIIISGSNTGGKTVTLKTIGLFVLMSMSGIGISCEEAILPMYDNILVDIGDEQSIEQSLSTFSSHITKMAQFCREIKSNTLILLDELGSGSDPKDSQNLAMAFLDYFRSKNTTILVTTHFEKIKEYGKMHDDILIASVLFDIEKMQPTYKYQEHQSGSSNALYIAQRLGVMPEIIRLAQSYEEINESERLMKNLDEEFIILKQKQDELEQEQAQFNQLKKAYTIKQEEMNREFQMQMEEKEKQFNLRLEELENQANQYLEELKKQEVLPKAIHHKKQIIALKKEEIKQEDTAIELGDYVEIVSLHYFGTVEKIQGSQYTINSNGVKLTTKLKDLKKAQSPVVKAKKTHHVSKVTTSVAEVNVIGLTVVEAWSIIDKMLDAAILANRSTFTIIHGVGTGKLREGIHAKLKKHKHVARFGLTSNLGATEVVFK